MNPPVAFPPTVADPTTGNEQAVQETLELLEWPRVCDHLASFASTGMGRDAARSLVLPDSLEASKQRQAETVEMAVLDVADSELVRSSGKFELLDRMLPKLKRAGHRV